MKLLKEAIAKLLPAGHRKVAPEDLPAEGPMPELTGLDGWLNSPPLTKESLKGKVVLVDFWTYSCVNCLRTLPHLARLHEAYRDKGLVIIGVHTPEFGFEKDQAAVAAALKRYGVGYPVALDSGYSLWRAFRNRYWPAHYFVDAHGDIRYHHFGEGDYAHSERVIRTLLEEAGATGLPAPVEDGGNSGGELNRVGTPETYLGWQRLEALGSPESVRLRQPQTYSAPPEPAKNIFYLVGQWRIEDEYAVPLEAGARLLYRYQASRANLVMEPDGARADVEIKLDGVPLLQSYAGQDIGYANSRAYLTVDEPRLYSLTDGGDDYSSHLLELTFTSVPGPKCYAFTFG